MPRQGRGIYFSRRKRRLPWILLIVAVILILLTAHLSQRPGGEAPKKAAILDGLSIDYPNRTFIESAKKILERAGFTVESQSYTSHR